MKISVTERAEFRACRRRWRYSYVLGYKPREETPHLWFGIGIHQALESYYTGTDLRLTRAIDAWEKYFSESSENMVTEKQQEMDILAHNMLISYHGYAQTFDNFEVVGLENRVEVPVLYPKTRQPVPDSRFVGRTDMDILINGEPWIVDHKTSLAELDYRGLDVDDQVTGYCYLYWRRTGVVPAGILYNVLLKGVYAPPTVLKDGKLSKSKSQGTNYHLYRTAIADRGDKESDYTDILAHLKTEQPVRRYTSSRSLEELLSFEENLYQEYRDMRKAKKQPELAYPNPGATNCSWCRALSLCILQNKKEDYGWVLDNLFTVEP